MFAASKTSAATAGAPPASTDPQFNYVTLLLNDTGTNGQQNNTFLDSSTNNFTITRNGTPTQGSVTPYWPDGQWSNYFNGSSSLSLTSANLILTGDFTFEGWLFFDPATTGDFIFCIGNEASGRLLLGVNAGGTLVYDLFGLGTTSFGGTFPKGSWNYFTFVRSGSTMTAYINGVSTGTTRTLSGTRGNSSGAYVWGASSGSRTTTGYLSNMRLIRGTALYTSNFTPSTTPLTAVSGTSLLTCQSNRFKDNSSNNFAITVTGTPTVQAFDPFSPAASYATSVGGSGYYGGSGQGTRIADSTAFDLAGGAYTIEFWVAPISYTTEAVLIGQNDYGTSGEWDIRIRTTGNIRVAYNSTGAATIDSLAPISRNAWTHVAVVDNGSQTVLYVNGVQQGTSATRIANSTRNLGIGCASNFNAPLTGYLANLRIVKGTAVYTSNFTPPTSPVTAITGTSLLLNCTNAGIYDAATLNDLVTVGNAQVSTAQAKFGSSSIAFDGTGDWLTFPDSPVMQLGTGNFTIEGWLYLPILGTARGIVSKGTSTTGWSVGVNLLNQFTFAYTTSTLTAATALTMGQWIHFAVVRNGSATGNVKIYFNGVLDATSGGAINDNFNQTSIGYVGADRVGTSPMNGYIDELRITKGYARYTSAFTPPTAPFPTR